jgi:hypothetical protein
LQLFWFVLASIYIAKKIIVFIYIVTQRAPLTRIGIVDNVINQKM